MACGGGPVHTSGEPPRRKCAFTQDWANITIRNKRIFLISVSIVVFQQNESLLKSTIDSLAYAYARVPSEGVDGALRVYIVDNNPEPSANLEYALAGLRILGRKCVVRVIHGQGNVGFGSGHNLAIRETTSRYHLVLNPDIDMAPDALVEAVRFMEWNLDVGLLTPQVTDESGSLQYLCRRFPTVWDLFVRGFLSPDWRRFFARRLGEYEMRDVIGPTNIVWDLPIATGCFMFFRTEILKQLGGFDPRYFLYFEDYDVSLRAASVGRLAYVPAVRAIHFGGDASRKGWRHVKMFSASAVRFFNRFGWRWI